MGLRFLNASTIQPKRGCRPKRSPSSATVRQVTQYHIEQIDLPSNIGLYGQRQIMALMEMILANEPVGVLDPSMQDYFNIANELVSQLRANTLTRKPYANC
ncbi:hypothetical protein [uncultured Shewanella sp.]|uniref:hypothetical protein n=1 Tax=uncultured Shewanella sp. TaxID=173975 RepID=UPI00260DFCAE|nr:hypothetical protein [uncultured Shewanella sp.]